MEKYKQVWMNQEIHTQSDWEFFHGEKKCLHTHRFEELIIRNNGWFRSKSIANVCLSCVHLISQNCHTKKQTRSMNRCFPSKSDQLPFLQYIVFTLPDLHVLFMFFCMSVKEKNFEFSHFGRNRTVSCHFDVVLR